MRPQASFVVASHNYGRFVAQAVDSLLSQSCESLEVIVIDDGSIDDTQEVLARYAVEPRVRVICHQQRQGHIRTYNEGLAIAEGRFVGLLSADDYCLDLGAVERQIRVFEEHPSVGMVYSAFVLAKGGGTMMKTIPWPEDYVRSGIEEFRNLMWSNYIPASGTLVRREVQAELGGYEPLLPHCADWDMWLRAAARHDVGYIAEPMYAYRVHDSNMSHATVPPAQAADELVLALERGFDALPTVFPDDIGRARAGALRHALLQTVWVDYWHARRARSWQGLVHALRRRPSMLGHREFWSLVPRLLMMTALGRAGS